MHVPLSLAALLASPALAETVLGVYIFHRHGDRTPKALAPANLTDLGYSEVYQAGQYFRSRYVQNGAPSRISGINSDTVKLSQLSISAPVDNVLMNSAQGFSQALYPAVASSDTLRNGSRVSAPMDGYQLIPISTVSNGQGQGAENSVWLQDSSNCGRAIASSNDYFSSPEYNQLASSSMDFYKQLVPVVNSTFSPSQVTYKNAYTLFDYINVGVIHNQTIPSQDVLTPNTLAQLQGLAATHEYNLAYNASSPIRGIAGMQLAAEALQYLNTTVAKPNGPKLGIQFGAYATMQSYFGLANLTNVPGAPGSGVSFTGIPDYASALVWELYTPADRAPAYPVAPSELMVRFSFHNGTSSNGSAPAAYPLFGGSQTSVPWSDFVAATNKFAVGSGQQWCQACGNSTGQCAQYAATANGGNGQSLPGASEGRGGSGISNAVAGVIGAMVTLAVVLLAELAVLLLFGLRLVSKRRLAAGAASNGQVEKVATGSS